jgi:Ca2+-binding EF-hand superfamily protein
MNSPHRNHPSVAPISRLFLVAILLASTPLAFAQRGGNTGNTNNNNNNNNNSSSSTTTKKAPDEATKLLEKYDASHNNKIDKDEMALMQALESNVYTDVILFDRDKSGSLDATELGRWKDAKTPATTTAQLIARYDANHNNKLDKPEWALMESKEPSVATDVQRFDLNKDSILDASELSKWADFKKSSTAAKPSTGTRG